MAEEEVDMDKVPLSSEDRASLLGWHALQLVFGVVHWTRAPGTESLALTLSAGHVSQGGLGHEIIENAN